MELYRMRYAKGTKLRLAAGLDDPCTPKAAGDIFIVDFVDDAGQIHGHFKSGVSLALMPETDSFEVVG